MSEHKRIGLLEGQPFGFKLQEMFAAGANFLLSRALIVFLLLIPVAFPVELVRDSSADAFRRLLLGRADGRSLISIGSREEDA